jgi:2-polyprenyl-6-methoxyphenol hydroxylase-like FAD-dependent oxidoreductase
MVTLQGAGEDHPPTDEAGFLGFARGLRSPLLYEAIRNADPRSPIRGYRRTGNQRRHYERMRRWPERFVVVGDAACVVNPVYGEGMSIAAMTAVRLDRCLSETGGVPEGFARRFQRRVARCSAGAWLIATIEDLRYPTTTGARVGARTRCAHWYLDRVMRAANRNAPTNTALVRVLGLVARPRLLFRPAVMIRALALGRSRAAPAIGPHEVEDQLSFPHR